MDIIITKPIDSLEVFAERLKAKTWKREIHSGKQKHRIHREAAEKLLTEGEKILEKYIHENGYIYIIGEK